VIFCQEFYNFYFILGSDLSHIVSGDAVAARRSSDMFWIFYLNNFIFSILDFDLVHTVSIYLLQRSQPIIHTVQYFQDLYSYLLFIQFSVGPAHCV